MPFPDESFDAETRSMMTRVLEEAWREVRALLIAEPMDESALRAKLASGSLPRCKKGSAILSSSS